MATFPDLEPETRSYSHGVYPIATQGIFAADPVLFLHAPKPFGYRLRLAYNYLTAAEAKLIRDHWRTQSGSTESFLLSEPVMRGHGSMGIVSEAKRWRYSGPPVEQQLTGGLINITLELETAEDILAIGAAIKITLAMIGGKASVTTSAMAVSLPVFFAPGSAQGPDRQVAGADMVATVGLISGMAGGPAFQNTVTAALSAGAAGASATGMAEIIGATLVAGAAVAF